MNSQAHVDSLLDSVHRSSMKISSMTPSDTLPSSLGGAAGVVVGWYRDNCLVVCDNQRESHCVSVLVVTDGSGHINIVIGCISAITGVNECLRQNFRACRTHLCILYHETCRDLLFRVGDSTVSPPPVISLQSPVVRGLE